MVLGGLSVRRGAGRTGLRAEFTCFQGHLMRTVEIGVRTGHCASPFPRRSGRVMVPAVSPLSRFYAATFGPFLLIPITILIASYDDRVGQLLLWATLGVFAASTIYAQLFARCPKCGWRIASFGKPFVRSLPPRECPRCGTDLSRFT